ncbi:MAG: hypothetical protein AAF411_12085 [Myxococcota bacterium]
MPMPRTAAFLVLLVACGGDPAPTSSPTPPAPPPVNEDAPRVEVHEWGLLDVAADGSYELAAGPGEPEPADRPDPTVTTGVHPAPAGTTPMSAGNMGTANTGAGPIRPIRRPARRKPVLYFHMSGAQAMPMQVGVTVPGRIAEHFPIVETNGQTLSWNVELSAGPCDAITYPRRDGAECQNVPDGYCELADLPDYVTADGACVAVGRTKYDFLFYRSGGGAMSMPLIPRSVDGQIEVHNHSLDQDQRVHLLDFQGGVVVGSSVAVGGDRASFLPPTAEGALQVRRELAANLRQGGLTEAEAGAFERAWFDELFNADPTGGAPVVRRAVLYALPESALSGVSQLSFEPAPDDVKRVFWVRHEI